MEPTEGKYSIVDVIQQIGKEREVPKGFFEKPDGLVYPERLKNPNPQITIYGKVDQEMFKNVSLTLQEISESSGSLQSLHVNFSSPGGEVTPGFGVYDLLTVFGREYNVPISITGYGPIMSMGVIILQAGNIRRMPENSRMLLHPISINISGDVTKAERQAVWSREDYIMYTQIIAERIQKAGHDVTAEDVGALMEANSGAGTYLTSEKAFEFGLIDEIV